MTSKAATGFQLELCDETREMWSGLLRYFATEEQEIIIMARIHIFSGLIFLLLCQVVGWKEAAMASIKEEPIEPELPPAEIEPPPPAFLEQYYAYLYEQKYTLMLGEDRASCAYLIDPRDVYGQGTTRFVTAIVTRGRGTACSGYLGFKVLQADCEANTLYAIQQQGTGDIRSQPLERVEQSLFTSDSQPELETPLDEIKGPPAEQICALPLSPGAVAEPADQLLVD